MLNPMPHKLINYYSDMSNIKLINFFGFCKVEIITPKNLIYPLLPYRKDGLTIHPTGKFTGIYFSEELKIVETQGYKIKLLEGYEFTKFNLFNDFINNFYDQKRKSIGPERLISKLHLNTLYGYFGRSFNLIETLIVKIKDIGGIALDRTIKKFLRN